MNSFNELNASKLCKIYGKRKVVNGVNVNIKRGEVVGLLGPNGAGKTTTFYMITGMVTPHSGNMFLDDLDITSMPMYKRARNGIGYLSQEPSVFTKLSVEDNIQAILETTDLTKDEQKDRLEELLDEFSITHIRKSIAYTLSGGERRRTEIARCLVTNPSFVLLDEPFAGIDPIAVEEVQKIIQKLSSKNIGVLITDHNVRETLKIIDKVYIVNEGKIYFEGNPEEAVRNENIKKFYLGSDFKI